MVDIYRTIDSVKITYLPMLQHFALAAIERRHYHDAFGFVETAAPPAAGKLHAHPAYTINRNLVLTWRHVIPVHVLVQAVAVATRSGPEKGGPCAQIA